MLISLKYILFATIVCLGFPSLSSTLNITQMSVPSIVFASDKATLSCTKEEDKENDKFISLQWYKLINGKWELFTEFPIQTEANPNMTTAAPINYYKLEDLAEPTTNDRTVEFTKSSLSTAGWYKCSIKSTLRTEEKEMELRVVYKPDETLSPFMWHTVTNDYITVTCSAPASYPITALRFFINYELAADGEVRNLSPVSVKNTTYGETVELPMNVAELKIRPTQHYVMNGKLKVVCTASLANLYNKFAELEIEYNGPIFVNKCLSGFMIALIVGAVLFAIVIVFAIIWFIIRKKKINAVNKVAELFNKQKTVLVDK